MIKTKAQLKQILKAEKKLYMPKKSGFKLMLTSDNTYKIYCFLKTLRRAEYYYNNRSNPINAVLYFLCRRTKNIQGRRLGIEMHPNTFDEGVKIWHAGNIVINAHAAVGKNCVLHGSNCIGNNGKDSACPVIGDNVKLGVGAKIIGDVKIADNVTIAAGAVVISSCLTKGAVLAGVPAKCVKVNE